MLTLLGTARPVKSTRKATPKLVIPASKGIQAASRPNGLPKSNRSTNHLGQNGSSVSGSRMGLGQSRQHTEVSETSSVEEARRRRNMAIGNAVTDTEARMTPAEKAHMKETVRRIINDKIRADWKWEWPQPEGEMERNLTMPKTPNEDIRTLDDEQWRERDEWESDVSESEKQTNGETTNGAVKPNPREPSPEDFDVAQVFRNFRRAKQKTRRRKRLARELIWNEGLQCYHARQQAWTCARYPPPPSPTRSPSPPEDINIVDFAPQTPPLPPSPPSPPRCAEEEVDIPNLPITEVPIAPPLLPPNIKLRDAITPANYDLIYDKIVTLSATPTMPINLSHIVSSCVQGWKRNGEWPPKPAPSEPPMFVRKKRSSKVIEDLFMKEKDGVFSSGDKDEGAEKGKGRGLRRGIQRIFGLGNGQENGDGTPGKD